MPTKKEEWFRRLFKIQIPGKHHAIAPGLYHAIREVDGNYTRLHLRVDRDGSGMLLANSTAAARLSPAGVMIAKALLDDADDETILRRLAEHFQGASAAAMQSDIQRMRALLANLVAPGDNYPIINVGAAFDVIPNIREGQLIAPLVADVPLAEPSLLVPIIDRLWAVGIPHVTLLAPEQPVADHLLRAIERAEDLGMIAGVRGRGSDLQQGTLLRDLAQVGVDHITVVYAAADPTVHDMLCGAGDHAAVEDVIAGTQAYEVCAVAEVALIEPTLERLATTLAHLQARHVTNISFFALVQPDTDTAVIQTTAEGVLPARAMPQVATQIEEAAHTAQVRFIWQPPVQFDPTRSVAEHVRRGPRCSGDVAIRVEPDGTVIPPRGPYQSAGNILHDEWETIWNHSAFRMYRERVETATRCDVCPGLAICAVECPREPAGWSL